MVSSSAAHILRAHRGSLTSHIRQSVPTAPRIEPGSGGLLDFIADITPGYERPVHLGPLIDALERAHKEPLRIVCHAPPRHGKTDSVIRAIAWYLRQDPRMLCGYATYGANLSYSKSREARAIARAAGVEMAPDAQGVAEWRTRSGGGLLATGVGGPLTGFGTKILFIDDPFKNRMEAESTARRRHVLDWWRDVARTRIEPGGSVIVFATRWHPEDLSGHLIKQGWRYIRLPAIADTTEHGRSPGQALWPVRYNEKALEEIRRDVGEYTWASLYQGLPRPRGGSVFHAEPKLYSADALAEILKNPKGFRRGIGGDFAYSSKTSADYSALIAGLGVQIEGQRYLYVLEGLRRQLEAPEVAKLGNALQTKHGGAARCPALAYVSTTERGVAQLMAGYGFRVEAQLAAADKFTRAQPYAATWNDGRVLLPEDVGPESWVNVFLAEHLSFTGTDGEEDDQVDAGAALHDLLARNAATASGAAPPPLAVADPDARGIFG